MKYATPSEMKHASRAFFLAVCAALLVACFTVCLFLTGCFSNKEEAVLENQASDQLKTSTGIHSLPEPLLTFLSIEYGRKTPYDTSEIVRFSLTVSGPEKDVETQYYDDEETVATFASAIEGINVVDKTEDTPDTGKADVYTYDAYDINDLSVLDFSISANALIEDDGMYELEGLDALFNIKGAKTDM